MPDQAHYGAVHIEWFHDSYESYRIIETYDMIGNALYWAEEGFGVIFCLKDLVDTQGTNLVFRPVTSSISAHVTMLTKKISDIFKTGKTIYGYIEKYLKPIIHFFSPLNTAQGTSQPYRNSQGSAFILIYAVLLF